MKIFCVIPAYNEEKNIKDVVLKVLNQTSNVIVVDDGSNDKTSVIAKEAGATVLKHFINRGQGAALETGNKYALGKGADVIFHFDADGQFLAEEIKDILEPLVKGEAEVVFGSRFMGRQNQMPGLKKNLIMPIARLVNRFVLGIKLTDPQCGFRAMTAFAWKEISIKQDAMAHCSEILYKAHKKRFKIKEVPVSVLYHSFGQDLSGGIRIFKDLLLSKLMD